MRDPGPAPLKDRSFAPRNRRRGPYMAFSPRLAGLLTASDALFTALPKRQGRLKRGGPWRILVSNLAHMGDVTVHLPLLKSLTQAPQVSHVGMLVSGAGAAVMRLFAPEIALHIHDTWSMDRSDRGRVLKLRADLQARGPLVQAIKRERYDVAIDAYPWFGNAATILWGAGVPTRIGFRSGGGGPLYTHRVEETLSETRSVAETSRLLLQPLEEAGLTLPEASVAQTFSPDPAAIALAKEAGRYAVLHLGRGEPFQAWPLDKWHHVADGLKARGYRLVFTGAQSEAAYGAQVRAGLADYDLLGIGDLRYFATILQQAALVISVDTVTPHLAGIFQTPTVVIPNGRNPLSWWRPEHPFVQQVMTVTACTPCYRKAGCEAMACLVETPPEAVLAAADALITTNASAAASSGR